MKYICEQSINNKYGLNILRLVAFIMHSYYFLYRIVLYYIRGVSTWWPGVAPAPPEIWLATPGAPPYQMSCDRLVFSKFLTASGGSRHV